MYCSLDDMVVRFGEDELASITDRSDSVSPVVDDEVVDEAIKDASLEIDGYIMRRYLRPEKPYPDALRLICCDIARWLMYDDSLDSDSIVQRRYDRAIKMLSNISSGDVSVGGLVKKPSPGAGVIRV